MHINGLLYKVSLQSLKEFAQQKKNLLNILNN